MEIEPKRQKTGGRTKGTPNKATAEVRAVALDHAPSALAELARLATGAENEATRVAACREILDRAYGRPKQELDIEHSGELTLKSVVISQLDSFFAVTAGRLTDQSDADVVSN